MPHDPQITTIFCTPRRWGCLYGHLKQKTLLPYKKDVIIVTGLEKPNILYGEIADLLGEKMDVKGTDNITIAVYKGFKRYKVLNISQRLLAWLVVVNSVLIIGCLIFFVGFVFQWAYNWKIAGENKTMQKEMPLLRK